MTTPEKLKKAENRLDWGEASIYVPEFRNFFVQGRKFTNPCGILQPEMAKGDDRYLSNNA